MAGCELVFVGDLLSQFLDELLQRADQVPLMRQIRLVRFDLAIDAIADTYWYFGATDYMSSRTP